MILIGTCFLCAFINISRIISFLRACLILHCSLMEQCGERLKNLSILCKQRGNNECNSLNKWLCSGEWYEAVFSDMLTKESLLVKVKLFHLLCRTN